MSVTARAIAAALALAALSGIAHAQLAPQWATCTGNPDIDWDQQIVSCSALIESGNETKENQAIAFFNRGLAYENKDEIGRAHV